MILRLIGRKRYGYILFRCFLPFPSSIEDYKKSRSIIENLKRQFVAENLRSLLTLDCNMILWSSFYFSPRIQSIKNPFKILDILIHPAHSYSSGQEFLWLTEEFKRLNSSRLTRAQKRVIILESVNIAKMWSLNNKIKLLPL